MDWEPIRVLGMCIAAMQPTDDICRERVRRMSLTTEQVWNAFQAPLQQFIRTRVSDEPTAEDILQEVFLKIHLRIGTLKEVKKLESWVYQITRNAIIDYYRSKEQPRASLDAPEVLELAEDLPDDDVVSDLFPAVRAMVKSLPEQDRQALVLTEYQGLTQKEYGERLGLSFSGAKSRVQRAREKLKQMLLECCHFELDRRNHIIDYQPHCRCCSTGACCADGVSMHTSSARGASLLNNPRLQDQRKQ
jgi:RNA polymerase sigma-70 factor, ECF subfamily